MIVIPKGHPSKLPPEAPSKVSPKGHPFEASSGNLSNPPARTTPLRSLSKPFRSPVEGLFSKFPPKPLPDRSPESATCPGSQPEAISPKAPFDTPSKQTLRSFLRNMPRVPKVKPKATPQAFRSRPEIPSGSTLGTRHVFPSAERKPFLREPSEPPRVPSLTPGESRIPPGSPECAAYPSAE